MHVEAEVHIAQLERHFAQTNEPEPELYDPTGQKVQVKVEQFKDKVQDPPDKLYPYSQLVQEVSVQFTHGNLQAGLHTCFPS